MSDISNFSLKKHEYGLIQKWNEHDIAMPKVIDFGTCNEGKSVYTLLEWIEGVEIGSSLKSLHSQERYDWGRKAGRILRKIHTISYTKNSENWLDRYYSVMNERIEAFKKEDVGFKGDFIVLDYLERNKYLLKERPMCYLHGDYHMGNIIIMPNGELKVIDWHTVDFDNYGDPWYEFNRIGIEYPDFATGQIDGYFEDNVPSEFWKLFAYYLSASAITSVVWTKYWAPDEYENIIKLNKNILKWYDDMKSEKPSWYRHSF
jgi:serine/threonine-protein kinase